MFICSATCWPTSTYFGSLPMTTDLDWLFSQGRVLVCVLHDKMCVVFVVSVRSVNCLVSLLMLPWHFSYLSRKYYSSVFVCLIHKAIMCLFNSKPSTWPWLIMSISVLYRILSLKEFEFCLYILIEKSFFLSFFHTDYLNCDIFLFFFSRGRREVTCRCVISCVML